MTQDDRPCTGCGMPALACRDRGLALAEGCCESCEHPVVSVTEPAETEAGRALLDAADALPRLAEQFKVALDANERRLVEWCSDRLRRIADDLPAAPVPAVPAEPGCTCGGPDDYGNHERDCGLHAAPAPPAETRVNLLAADLQAHIDRDPDRPTATVNRATLRAILAALPGPAETREAAARALLEMADAAEVREIPGQYARYEDDDIWCHTPEQVAEWLRARVAALAPAPTEGETPR